MLKRKDIVKIISPLRIGEQMDWETRYHESATMDTFRWTPLWEMDKNIVKDTKKADSDRLSLFITTQKKTSQND